MIKKITSFIILCLALTACDKVDCPNEGGCVEPQKNCISTILGYDTCLLSGSVSFFSDSATYKKVLVEEYTGFACNNCPEGARKLKQIKNKVGDTLVLVAIHAGSFADPNLWGSKYQTDFRTEAGNTYESLFGVNKNPVSVIERKQYSGTYQLTLDDWEPTVRTEITNANPNVPHIGLKVYYSAQSGTIMARASIKFFENSSAKHNLIFMLMEDNVIDVQLDGSTFVEEYEHNHVFRSAFGKTLGEIVNESTVESEALIKVESAYYTPNAEWVIGNCSVVAILYNAETLEAVQSTYVKLK